MIIDMPAVNTRELELIQNIIESNYHRSAFMVTDASKDDPNFFAALLETHKALDHLVEVGLLANETEDEGSVMLLESLKPYERVFRIFMVTELGKAMFNESMSENYAKPN